MAEGQIAANSDVLMCTVHPTVETTLRCNKCGRPMCIKCSVRTPVGYRCKECVKGQQAVFYSGGTMDGVIQGVVSVVLSAIAAGIVSYMASFIGFFGFFIAIAAGGAAGTAIMDVALRASGRRRTRYTWLVIAGGIVVGALIVLPFVFFNWIGWGIYVFTATSAAAGNLRLRRR